MAPAKAQRMLLSSLNILLTVVPILCFGFVVVSIVSLNAQNGCSPRFMGMVVCLLDCYGGFLSGAFVLKELRGGRRRIWS
jgi:hypothetical protein